MKREDPDELVTIARFTDPFEAEMLKGELKAFGIRSVICNENMANLRYGDLCPAEVKIRAADRDRVVSIISNRKELKDS